MATVSPEPAAGPDTSDVQDEKVRALIRATAPRLFALIEERETTPHGEPGPEIAAWGLAHRDGTAQVTTVRGHIHLSARSPDSAATLLALGRATDVHLVWPDTLTSPGGHG
ncbi:hypothetical protein [Streptomyces sp. JJ36]|uniref:hypothetical protein n=1 Tax=Streptomyces sp. JJ36 TaxID=2736645 RepID=UPI001F2D50B1|nr:hypothetical protein [Streptomyces sp. JJ36]MCF6521629.1 hypothetical protein [Streptomyces sp. JJ36]